MLGAPKEGEKTVRGKLIEISEEDLEVDLIAGLKQDIEMAGQFVETTRPVRYRITEIERFRVLDDPDADLE